MEQVPTNRSCGRGDFGSALHAGSKLSRFVLQFDLSHKDRFVIDDFGAGVDSFNGAFPVFEWERVQFDGDRLANFDVRDF